MPWHVIGFVKQMSNFGQQLNLLVLVSIAWPPIYIQTFELFTFFSFDLQLFSPECFAPVTLHDKFAVRILLPFSAVVVTAGAMKVIPWVFGPPPAAVVNSEGGAGRIPPPDAGRPSWQRRAAHFGASVRGAPQSQKAPSPSS